MYGPINDLSETTRFILTSNRVELKDNYYYIIVTEEVEYSYTYRVGGEFIHDIYKIGDPYKYTIIAIVYNNTLCGSLQLERGKTTFMIIGKPTKYSSPIDESKKKHLETEDD